ncbi:MAG: hypothetical protein ACHQZR_07310 [Candidatus Limnocylindrales bacterium]
MPKVPFLHPRSKIDQEEWALAQARVDARLADLFKADTAPADEDAPEAIDDGVATSESPTGPAGPGQWTGGPRPPIVVAGAGPTTLADVAADASDGESSTEGGEVDHVLQLRLDALDPAVASLAAAPIEMAPAHGNGHTPDGATAPADGTKPGRARARRTHKTRTRPTPTPAPTAHCPYCALVLAPPPTSSRRCTRCRQRIIVKRIDGRAVYLTEAAVLVFQAEQQRITTSARLTRERERWLRLAASVGAPDERIARLAAARLSEDVVGAARTLYTSTVDRAVRAARRDREWDTVSRLRRDNAAALYRLAGSPVPPPADIVALHREGVAAELRGIAEISRDAELISAACCDVCRQDDRTIFRIAPQLRAPRLPHEGCPRGLCRCRWDLAARDRSTMRRYLRRRPGAESRAAVKEPVPTA